MINTKINLFLRDFLWIILKLKNAFFNALFFKAPNFGLTFIKCHHIVHITSYDFMKIRMQRVRDCNNKKIQKISNFCLLILTGTLFVISTCTYFLTIPNSN